MKLLPAALTVHRIREAICRVVGPAIGPLVVVSFERGMFCVNTRERLSTDDIFRVQMAALRAFERIFEPDLIHDSDVIPGGRASLRP